MKAILSQGEQVSCATGGTGGATMTYEDGSADAGVDAGRRCKEAVDAPSPVTTGMPEFAPPEQAANDAVSATSVTPATKP